MGLENVQLHRVDSVESAGELMRWLSTRRRIGVDTETTGLSPDFDRIRLVQVGGGDHGWAIPWDRWSGVFEEIVAKFEGEYTFHNAPFDVPFIRRSGIKMPLDRVHDTHVMGHIIDPLNSTGLKQLAQRFVDPRANVLQQELDYALSDKKGWTWETVPLDFQPYWVYAAMDPVLTDRLRDVLEPKIMATAPASYELENSVQWVVEAMERRGTAVDREYTAQKYRDIQRYVEQVADWCEKTYGVKPGANAAVIEVLEKFGFEFTKPTKSGALSLDKEVLGAINHPLAAAVLSRRQLQKIASTYLRNFLVLSEYDGLVHPSINTLGARTSRMSMADPNLQNLSRKSEGNPAAECVRSCVIARPNHTLVMCDFEQIEMRLLAHVSQDKGLMSAFGLEEDFFTTVARDVYMDPSITRGDPRRQIAKNSGYAKIYGAGVEKFAWTAGVDVDVAARFLETFDNLYPGVRNFQWNVDQQARYRWENEGVPYVTSPLTGRRFVVESTDNAYRLVNYEIQGTACEIFKRKLLELDAAGLGEYMILPVHDEIISDVPTEYVRDAVEILRKVMNDDELLDVPIRASVSGGQRWSDKEEIAA